MSANNSVKVGNKVYTNDGMYGVIVEICDNVAQVEFRTDNGGGCLPYELDELEIIPDQWCIITNDFNEKLYLGWQNPVWDDSGYFWTNREVFDKIKHTYNTPDHPFIFDSKGQAVKHLKILNIPQRCRVIKL